jgi:hypothetical protein
MKSPLWRGSKEITEAPDSPKWDFQLEDTICVRVFYGPYATCLAKKPLNNQKMNDVGMYVVNVKVNKQAGGKGEMIVTLGQYAGFTTGLTAGVPAKVERDYIATDRKLEAHPRYAYNETGAVGAKELSMLDLVQLKKWEDESNSALRAAFKFTDGTEKTLSENAQDFARKKLKGQDSYTVYVPVLRRTSTWNVAPPGETCGKRIEASALPADIKALAPAGYAWLKTADRSPQSGRSGRYERFEEWTGFDSIDADIYT